jgi:hypothetical protein
MGAPRRRSGGQALVSGPFFMLWPSSYFWVLIVLYDVDLPLL